MREQPLISLAVATTDISHSMTSNHFFSGNAFRRPQYSRSLVSDSVTRSDLAEEAVTPVLDVDSRVPTTVITGFLGFGKMMLMNHILNAQHGKRIAAIENEFGEVDIDSSLVASYFSTPESIVMVNNGCLGCTVKGFAKPSPVIEIRMNCFCGI